jgi:hypothetical protein
MYSSSSHGTCWESEQFPGSHLPHSATCKAMIDYVCHLSAMWSTGEPDELGPSQHPVHVCWPATPISRVSTMLPTLITVLCPGESCWEWRIGSIGVLSWEAGPGSEESTASTVWVDIRGRADLYWASCSCQSSQAREGQKGYRLGFCKYMHHPSWLFISRVLPGLEDLGTSGWVYPQTLGHHPSQGERYYYTGRQG